MQPRTGHARPRRSLAGALRACTAVIAAATLVALPAMPTLAAEEDDSAGPPANLTEQAQDGTWYFTDFGIGALHEDEITGDGVTIAMIDTPLMADSPDLQDANVELKTSEVCDNGYDGTDDTEAAEHGTAMTSVIAGTDAGAGGERGIPGVAPGARVLHYAALTDPRESGCEITLADIARNAVDNGAKVLSMSFGWPDLDDLAEAVTIAHEAGAIVNIAVANESLDELDPESDMNGVIKVENIDVEGLSDGREVVSDELSVVAPGTNIRSPASNGGDWDAYRLSVGTSPATAWLSGVLALAWSKWPEATSNQLIQSVIRNTSNGWEELTRTDLEGFGLVSPHNLVTMDPKAYPDENPLLKDSGDDTPSWSDVMGDAEPTDWEFIDADIERGSSIPVDHPTKQPTPWIVTGPGIGTMAGVLLVIALGLGAAALVVVRNRRKAAGGVAATVGPGFGGAPSFAPQGGYGAPSGLGGYGATSGAGGFGAPGSPGGFGAPGGAGSYGAPGGAGSYGAPGSAGGLGSAGGYRAPGNPGGYGAPGSAGGYGAPGRAGGFAAQDARGGFGAPGGAGRFGSQAPAQWNAPAAQQPAAQQTPAPQYPSQPNQQPASQQQYLPPQQQRQYQQYLPPQQQYPPQQQSSPQQQHPAQSQNLPTQNQSQNPPPQNPPHQRPPSSWGPRSG